MTDKIIFQGSVRAGKTAAIIATLTAECARLRADLEKVTAEREELISMAEYFLKIFSRSITDNEPFNIADCVVSRNLIETKLDRLQGGK